MNQLPTIIHTKSPSDILKYAKDIGTDLHKYCNHQYDGMPYGVHLRMVELNAMRFINLLPDDEILRVNVLAACWLHDTIEDCRMTYNDILNLTNLTIAEIVYALTNEKGKTRAERANDNYYEGIKATPHATFVKVCDRLANVQYSKITGSEMLIKYQQEHAHFYKMLYDNNLNPLFEFLGQETFNN